MTARAFLHPAVLGIGAHVVHVRVWRAVRGHRRYHGTAEEILRAGLDACWSGEYLAASPGHYRQFWTRDAGFAAPALVRLGGAWPARLLSSVRWATGIWRRRRSRVTTTIYPLLRWPVDVFDYGVDSLPLLLASLRALTSSADPQVAASAAAFVEEHRPWITREVAHFFGQVVDPDTGLVRSDGRFSAHRDTFHNASTAYGNTMVALLARTLAETGWGPNVMSRYFAGDWGLLLRRHFWLGDRFRDRLGSDDTSGEANVWPFFSGVIDDPGMLAAALSTLRRDGYTAPYPLRFEARHQPDRLLALYRLWSPDYQTTTSWTSLGSMYLSLLGEADPAAASVELDRMRHLIERDGVLWEVLDAHGRPWRSRGRISVSDTSMLWGAILLDLMQRTQARAR